MKTIVKPYSEACEENKRPILAVIRKYFSVANHVLEVGSGTGQHAVFFAENLPEITWHCSDVKAYHEGILAWLRDYSGDNIKGPYELDVSQACWPMAQVDGIFSANTTHIMSWQNVEQLFTGIGTRLNDKGYFCLYGPFNYQANYTSNSNAQFDRYLKQRDPLSGIREFDDLQILAETACLTLVNDHEMPVNNRLLVWQKNH
ncbi:hypothetical protein MNBD_GAMMA21-2252 [hydrothermal vent metagenome]|uniref:Methylase n=1 Tax=hydrothermal vent metagenome TaxID=652676 RepID=A0A3B0ZP18_9ZZZZ